MIEEEVVRRLAAVEKRQKQLFAAGVLVVFCLMGIVVFQVWTSLALQKPQMLRVRQLAVVDEQGTERVLIGAPLPDPMILVKAPARWSCLRCDHRRLNGTERGVMSPRSRRKCNADFGRSGLQTMLLLAESDGGTTFRIWDRDKGQ